MYDEGGLSIAFLASAIGSKPQIWYEARVHAAVRIHMNYVILHGGLL